MKRSNHGRTALSVLATAVLMAVLPGVAGVAPAEAAVISRSGTINANDPTMDVVFINGTNDTCGAQGATDVRYEVVPWTAPVGGTTEFRLTSTPGNIASFYVYDGPFDPTNGTQNCVAADNSVDTPAGEKTVTLNAQDGRTYRLVIFDDTFAQNGVSFKMDIEVPGGKAIYPADGPGKKYLSLPGSFSCSSLDTNATWRGKANKVRSAVIKANGKVVARLFDRHIAPGRTTYLADLPGNTNRIVAQLKLKGGGKATVRRQYTRC